MICLRNTHAVGLFVLSMCAMVFAGSYVAVLPQYFHPGWPVNIPITVKIQGEGPLSTSFMARFYGSGSGSAETTIASASLVIDSGETKLLSLQVPLKVESALYKFYLELQSTGGVTMKELKLMQKVANNSVVIVQTDKNIYKPGQLVHFRLLHLNKDTVPRKVPLNVYMLNAKGTKLERFDNMTSVNGVVERDFQLPHYATLGMWGIQVEDEENNLLRKHLFKVDEYVLPKFSVDVTSEPEFLIWGIYNQPPAVIVNTKYTYGKAVQGECVLTIGRSYSGRQDRLVKQIPDNGIVEFTDIRWDYIVGPVSDVVLVASVKVTDVMGRTEEGETSINVFRGNYKLEILPESPIVMHSGLETKYYIRISDHFNNPATGLEAEVHIKMLDSTEIRIKTKMEEGKNYATVTFTAIGNIPDSIKQWDLKGTVEVRLVNDPEVMITKDIYWYASINRESLEIQSPMNKDIKKGEPLEFNVASTYSSTTSAIMGHFVMSQGIIVQAGPVENNKLQLTPTIEMCPRARLVVYQLIHKRMDVDAEVIANSVDINPSMCIGKQVTVTFDTKEQRTGTDAMMQINVKENDNSAIQQIHDIFYLAVDKSIVLLEGDTRLTTQRVLQALDDTNDWKLDEAIPFDTSTVFVELGLIVVTDAKISETKIRREFMHGDMLLNADIPMLKNSAESGNILEKESDDRRPVEAPKKIRQHFPDTWLWNHGRTTENGQFRTQVRLPDTITNWYVSAFAINDNGIAVSGSPFEITAFQPFFLALNLPYSVKKGEEFSLRITVFNYRSQAVNAVVLLEMNNGFTLTGGKLKNIWMEQTVTLPANLASSVSYNITATTIGKIKFHVIAEDSDDTLQRDEVIRHLIVKPAGEQRDFVVTEVLLLVDQTSMTKTINVQWPSTEKIVEGSQQLQVKVTGQIMGQSLSNLDTLVRIPVGCGEQNMITLVPNIYGALYIQQTNQFNSIDLVNGMINNMKIGYRRQVDRYVLGDGSYSAWGTQDSIGSTWLTAFVIKSFAAASKYISVSEKQLLKGIDFLLSKQKPSGHFLESGHVIHSEMQTGTDNGLPLTVYCLLSILETNKVVQTKSMDAAITKTVSLILRDLPSFKDSSDTNPFLPALTAYTLSMIKNPTIEVQEAIFDLLTNIEDSRVAWNNQSAVHHFRGKNPSQLMTAAYTLMTYLQLKNMPKAIPVMKWLQQRQNQKGGFHSTQDTILVLQALSQFGIAYKDIEATGQVYVRVPQTTANATIDISGARSGLLQVIDLPVTTKEVTVQLTGTTNTIAIVKLVATYNTLVEESTIEVLSRSTGSTAGDDLDLRTKSRYLSRAFHEVEACVKSKLKPGVGMFVASMYLPSGEVPADTVETMMIENPLASNIEIEEDIIHFYMDSVPSEGSCLKAKIEREIDFEVQLPGTTKFYSYYEPEYYKENALDLAEAIGCAQDQCDGAPTIKLTSLFLTVFICIMMSLLTCM